MTSSRPTFSVLVPAYNQAEYLRLALDSLLAQTDADWEAVVVNDGSTDSTAEVIAAFERKDPRIRGFYKSNGGAGSALNYGLRNATAEWICWLSSDDLFVPEKLEIHRKWITREPATAFFHTHFQTIGASGAGLESPPLWRDIPAPEWQVVEMLRGTYIHGLSVCIQRQAVIDVGGFDERLLHGQDYALWLRLLTRHRATFIPERTCIQRYHAGQTTNVFPEAPFYDSARAAIELLNSHTLEQLLPAVDLGDWKTATRAVDRTIDVASAFGSPFIYGLGQHALLLWRLVEWAVGHADAHIAKRRRQLVARRIRRTLRRTDDSSSRLQWKCALAVLGAVEGAFRYSSLSPLQIARARHVALLARYAPESEVFLKYLRALGDVAGGPVCEQSDFLPSREVVIVSQRGSSVDAEVKFGAARAQMALARHVAQQGGQVVLVGLSRWRHGYTEDIEFLGAETEKGLLRLLKSLTPHDVVVGISRADVFRHVAAARPLLYQHGPHAPEGERAVAVVKRQHVPVVVVSADSLEAQVRFGVPREQLHLVPNGYDANVFIADDRSERVPHRLVFAGNGVPYKGPDIAVRAFALLKEEFPDAEFLLFGSTVESWSQSDHVWRAEWIDINGQVSWANVQRDIPGVLHLGPVTAEDLAEAFRRASLLVMPSRIPETFGLVSIEAQACGCLPVLPRTGGYSSTMVPEQTGYLYDDNTPSGLATRIATLWGSGLPSDAQRAAAARWVRNEFSWGKADTAICAILERQIPRKQFRATLNQVVWATEHALRQYARPFLGPIVRRFRARARA